ncbi:MAG TPA: hypothetical protein VE198_06570 [Actinoallomurus sp.]|nr:hypothetical protein [Actinoallomurus sp.]
MATATMSEPAMLGSARLIRRPIVWLIGVAAMLVLIQFAVLVWSRGLGWDESLYVGQVSLRVPAANFSAPRARGITYLIAPAVWLTGSIPALRAYLAILGGAAIVIAYWPWLAVTSRRPAVPLAALLFSGLWITGYYTSEIIPNFWVAVAGVSLAGWFVRYAGAGGRAALVGVVLSGAVVALMRPGDAFWIALPLLLGVVLVRRWRRPALLFAVVAGLVLGVAEWIIEALVRFGGPLARLRQSSANEGGMSWNPNGAIYELHALNGPLLCRPCGVGVGNPALALWWLAIPLLVAGGLILAARARNLTPAAVATVCGVSAAVPYMLLLGYAAPRFLLPAYAMLALPVAECLTRLPQSFPRARWPLVAIIGLTVVGHLCIQQLTLVRQAHHNSAEKMMYIHGATALERLGLRSPCLLNGPRSIPIAFYVRCRTDDTTNIPTSMTRAQRLAVSRGEPIAILSPGTPPPPYAASWTERPVPAIGPRWVVYLSPDL